MPALAPNNAGAVPSAATFMKCLRLTDSFKNDILRLPGVPVIVSESGPNGAGEPRRLDPVFPREFG
jgi:hypothetical protein